MMGGEWFNKYFGSNATEQTLEQIAIAEVSKILNTTQEPKRVITRIHKVRNINGVKIFNCSFLELYSSISVKSCKERETNH